VTVDDKTYAELQEIAARYPERRSGLLPMLHLVQSVEGRVTSRGIEACADILGLSAAEVSGVATFYTMYKRRPVGDYHVGVCTTALCAIMGGDEVLSTLQDHLGIGNDETTEDGLITLEHVECNAACDFAPVMMVNWEFFDNTTPQRAVEVVDALRSGQEVTATALLERFGFTGDRLTARLGDLSGGERRRFQLLKLLLTEPNVLLLDEPTNNLDPASREEVLHAIRSYTGAIILVTHDEGAVRALDPDRVLLLPDGDEDLWSEEYADLVSLA
jgi:NADH-quinone oxidoreductase subunit E